MKYAFLTIVAFILSVGIAGAAPDQAKVKAPDQVKKVVPDQAKTAKPDQCRKLFRLHLRK